MAGKTNLPLFIGGKACKAISRKKFENINPATGEKICDVEQAGRRDIEKAVGAARKGFAVWSAMSGTERGRILIKAAQILRERRKELAEIEVKDTGKPISEAMVVDIDSGADALEFLAVWLRISKAITMIGHGCLCLHTPGTFGNLRWYRCMELSHADCMLEDGTSARLWQLNDIQTI